MGHPVLWRTVKQIPPLRYGMTGKTKSAGYLYDLAVAKRLLTSSQLTTFHHAAR